MSNAVRISYYDNKYPRRPHTVTVVIQRGARILAKAECRTFKQALAAAKQKKGRSK
jgi:hypothetical protein